MSQNSVIFVRPHRDGSAYINGTFLSKREYDEYKVEVDKSRKITAIASILAYLVHNIIKYTTAFTTLLLLYYFSKQILQVC